MHEISATAGTGVHTVTVTGLLLGADLCLAFGGGTNAHIGAVALATPRPSLEDKARISASSSVLCVIGHKEDLLARALSLKAATCLNCRVSVSVGLHIDGADKNDIDLLQENCNAALDLLIIKLEQTKKE